MTNIPGQHVPSIFDEWNAEQNGELTPESFGVFSKKKVWWICAEGHVWEAKIASRSQGSGCPICKVYKATSGNCLAAMKPELSAEWNERRNRGLTPYEVSVFSKKRVWWECRNGHEWQVSVYTRSRGAGCPQCSTSEHKNKSVVQEHPELVKEWHADKNDVRLEALTTGSSRKVWWICGKGHEWQASVKHRCRGTGCPYCTGKKVSADNRLSAVNPELAKQWHPSRNPDLTPHDVTAGSSKKVWWLCGHGHAWRASIHSRHHARRGCPLCRRGKSH